jgi:hypothetical protein
MASYCLRFQNNYSSQCYYSNRIHTTRVIKLRELIMLHFFSKFDLVMTSYCLRFQNNYSSQCYYSNRIHTTRVKENSLCYIFFSTFKYDINLHASMFHLMPCCYASIIPKVVSKGKLKWTLNHLFL